MSTLKPGLTRAAVQAQLAKFGYNEFEEKKLTHVVESLLKILLDPMGLMLLILGIVYWTLGEYHDATILLVAYVPIVTIDIALELHSEKALRSLKKTLKSSCQVIRDGKTISIPNRELVPGDLLLLEEGQTIPADGTLIEASNLTIDESSLTGESIPIEKIVPDNALSGTVVLTGHGIVEITKTGLTSQIGSIAKVLKEFKSTPSPLLRSVNKVTKIAFYLALLLAAVIFIEGVLSSKGFASSLVSALTLAMAAIPEEFPLVFTLYLSVAAYRLSKIGVLVKSLPAVEGLGRVDIICTDKTGTLTEGNFRLERILTAQAQRDLNGDEVRALVFSCEEKPVDAMESSIFEWVRLTYGHSLIDNTHAQWSLEFDYPFDTKQKYMSHVWKSRDTSGQVMAMKGALEGVIEHCELTDEEKKSIFSLAEKEAEAGRRLLGLATKSGKFDGNRASDETALKFIGVLSFTDPVRSGVPFAIRHCISKDIQIRMLTGDHLLTAHSIADKIGLPHQHDGLFSGPELASFSPQARLAAFQKGTIFARLKPEQKLELIKALQANGKIVAMIGDGINDAPALKLADIGISMGERATDVARSTAQLILLKNDFNGIVASVLEGRRVRRSLKHSFAYLIAFHIPIVFLALFQSMFLDSSILLPIHIVLMELIVHPISAFVFDAPNSPDAKPHQELISRSEIYWSCARGSLLSVLSLSAYFFSHGALESRRSLAVLVLVAGNIGLILAESNGVMGALLNLSSYKRTALASILLLALASALAYVPFVTELFSLTHPHLLYFSLTVVTGILLGAVSTRRSPLHQERI